MGSCVDAWQRQGFVWNCLLHPENFKRNSRELDTSNVSKIAKENISYTYVGVSVYIYKQVRVKKGILKGSGVKGS